MGRTEAVPGAIDATSALVRRLPPEPGVEPDAGAGARPVGPVPGARLALELQEEAEVAKGVGGPAGRATTRVGAAHGTGALPPVLRPIQREAYAPGAEGVAKAGLPHVPVAVAHAIARRPPGPTPKGERARVEVRPMVPPCPARATLAEEAAAPPVRPAASAAPQRAPVGGVDEAPAVRTPPLPVIGAAMVQAQAGSVSAVGARPATPGMGSKEGDDRPAKNAPPAPGRQEAVRYARVNRLKTAEAHPGSAAAVRRGRRAAAAKAVGGRDVAPDARRKAAREAPEGERAPDRERDARRSGPRGAHVTPPYSLLLERRGHRR